MRLRSQAQIEELKAVESEQTPKSKLFRTATPVKKRRLSADGVRDMRANPTQIAVTVPGRGGWEESTVHFVRPAHPCDELAVKLDPDELEHIAFFIRHECAAPTALLDAKRGYGYAQSELNAPKGVW